MSAREPNTTPPPPPTAEGARGQRRGLRLAVQLAGFLLGLALLGWCADVALSADNREQVARLTEASAGEAAALVGLSAAVLVVNGLVFWVVVRPAQRLRAADVVATSCIASFLALLPFKLSVAARVAIHHRRDRVPLLVIGAWFGAVGGLFVGSVGVLAASAAWAKGIDGRFALASGLGLTAFSLVTIAGARWFRGERGRARIETITRRASPGRLEAWALRAVRSRLFGQLHRGFDMLASPVAVVGAVVLRLVDVALQAGRFWLAGGVIAAEGAKGVVDGESAVLLACAHASIGLVSPFGTLGTREAGTLALAAAFGLAGAGGVMGADGRGEALAVVLLLVGAVDAVTALACAGLGVAWLRPDRLLRATGGDGGS